MVRPTLRIFLSDTMTLTGLFQDAPVTTLAGCKLLENVVFRIPVARKQGNETVSGFFVWVSHQNLGPTPGSSGFSYSTPIDLAIFSIRSEPSRSWSPARL
jgi:hypothetical protein